MGHFDSLQANNLPKIVIVLEKAAKKTNVLPVRPPFYGIAEL